MSLQAHLQTRLHGHGWPMASTACQCQRPSRMPEPHRRLLHLAEPAPSERVVEVGCGTGSIVLAAADKVGPGGRVVGFDSSSSGLDIAQAQAQALGLDHVRLERMQGGPLPLPDSSVDLLYSVLQLPCMPEPKQVLRDMHRVLRPGGRIALMVWGKRAQCGWSSALSLLELETGTRREPAAFQFGRADALANVCRNSGFVELRQQRLATSTHHYSAQEACDAAVVEMEREWPDMDPRTWARIESRYVRTIAAWKTGAGYRMPAEFVLLVARKPESCFR